MEATYTLRDPGNNFDDLTRRHLSVEHIRASGGTNEEILGKVDPPKLDPEVKVIKSSNAPYSN